jgi:serine/threonine protein kinase
VFEYCEHDMARLMDLKRAPFTEAEVKCLVRQLLHAVVFLHTHSIMHRDLKLSNLLFTNTGALKLCDFGLARHFQPVDDGSYTPKVRVAPSVLCVIQNGFAHMAQPAREMLVQLASMVWTVSGSSPRVGREICCFGEIVTLAERNSRVLSVAFRG